MLVFFTQEFVVNLNGGGLFLTSIPPTVFANVAKKLA
jgi:hypothetical protein